MTRPATPPAGANRAARALGDPRSVPDMRWLGRLSGADPDELQQVLGELGEKVELERTVHGAHLSHGRDFYAQFRAPFELYAIVRLIRPAHVIETGVSSGVSSMHLLLGLNANRRGQLHSIDLPTHQAGPVLSPSESPVFSMNSMTWSSSISVVPASYSATRCASDV
ncbi:MAG: class I SAM-dependent methyltransferase, partial [Thermoplasmata archaeon]|nr:class I SAM-dependent methyltransferase [Thermoplasmata archaeon]